MKKKKNTLNIYSVWLPYKLSQVTMQIGGCVVERCIARLDRLCVKRIPTNLLPILAGIVIVLTAFASHSVIVYLRHIT